MVKDEELSYTLIQLHYGFEEVQGRAWQFQRRSQPQDSCSMSTGGHAVDENRRVKVCSGKVELTTFLPR